MIKVIESMNKKIKKRSKDIFQTSLLLLPLLICVLLFTLIPIFHTFAKSLRFLPNEADRTSYEINFNNYNNILSDKLFQHAVLNSTLVLIFGSGFSITLALLFALLINSLLFKTSKRIFISIIYSQFFISGFAIGIAFSMFFGSKNLFFYILGLDKYSFMLGDHKLPIWIYYSIFQLWRSLPFNLVLFAASLSRAEAKYYRLMRNDKLTMFQKFRFVYANEISKVLFSVLFTNFIFSTLLLPEAILEPTYSVDSNLAHTLTSYTLKFLGSGNNSSLKFEKGYASAFFSFAYLLSLLCIIQLLRIKTIKGIYFKIIKLKGNKNNDHQNN
nr:sugar ABC transporter permease [Mycoplasma yeatsii]